MTDRVLLAVSAALNAFNGAVLAVDQGGVYDVPGAVLAVSAIVSLTFAAFVANFVRMSGAQ